MKKFHVLYLLILLSFSSCLKDEPIPSCLDLNVEKQSTIGPIEAEVYTTKKIACTISNSCKFPIEIFEAEIDNDTNNEFRLEGISKGTKITGTLNFNLVSTPQTKGNKTASVTILSDDGTIHLQVGFKGI
ncbi:hypothetical protein [Tenacibaculum sp. IB213877]|uniref:hypothetical protein n=1 Tax=Tenacibaculum sp. IB213877 TaxID=3097351 RepID=UPI002A5986BE|nr:hypothetical protein [Tenacibaculum sp. IB213877]MDY0779552.1 hypothetical protein [Tenacibaculum sp. IB213877]